jgi:metal-responsive CopG/Arc/MetJ family transcriptional regulator
MIAEIDKWAIRNGTPSRSEAMRLLIQHGLAGKPKAKR